MSWMKQAGASYLLAQHLLNEELKVQDYERIPDEVLYHELYLRHAISACGANMPTVKLMLFVMDYLDHLDAFDVLEASEITR